jgi:hypothetical protein
MLHVANITAGDCILDQCAGIGTIPIESTFMSLLNSNNKKSKNNYRQVASSSVIALGGDLALQQSSDRHINESSIDRYVNMKINEKEEEVDPKILHQLQQKDKANHGSNVVKINSTTKASAIGDPNDDENCGNINRFRPLAIKYWNDAKDLHYRQQQQQQDRNCSFHRNAVC